MQKRQTVIDTRKIQSENIRRQENQRLIDDNPYDFLISEHSQDVFFHWKAPEFEVFERDRNWYFWMGLILLLIIAWALYVNSPLMAITFILIGIVGYMHSNAEPKILDFLVTRDGVVAGKDLYEFENIRSFWIFYEPEGLRVISLHLKSGFLPYIHIPVHDQDPAKIREVLLEYIEEEKHEPGIVETMERILKI